MTKLIQIQNALRTMNGARFQELCDRYIYREGYHQITRIGAVIGKEKTRTGRPDTRLSVSRGRYVFVESTTQDEGLFEKLMKDVESCFQEAETGIPVERIEKIILCHNSKLSGAEELALESKAQEHERPLEIWGIDSLSLGLLEKHQSLAKEYLGIELDTDQILPPEDFIKQYQKNPLVTPLDLKFHRRTKELKDALEALKTNDLLIISGPTGVGKSRFALECMNKFIARHASYQPFCILNKGLDLHEDLIAYVGNDGNYLLFVDDANRLARLKQVLQLLHEQRENRQTKIILTVRDYAARDVVKMTRAYVATAAELQLHPFTDEEIAKIIETEFDIRNPSYLEQICKIAKGNPRLAVMAAKLAKETQRFESISDASSLYDQYFSSITDDLKDLEAGKLLDLGGILAFFDSLDRTKELFKQIIESFGLSKEEFWDGIDQLHAAEVVDLHGSEVVKFSDQVFATYLFYRVFFKLETLDFSVLLSDYLPSYEYRFRDAVYGVLEIFDHDFVLNRLQKHVDARWQAANGDETQLLPLMRVFWFVKKAETLLFLKNKIDSLPAPKIDFANKSFEPAAQGVMDRYLGILEEFQNANANDFRIAFELILVYLAKQSSLLSQVIFILLETFSFDLNSANHHYRRQQIVIDTLIEKSADPQFGLLHKRLLLRIAQNYLKTQFRTQQAQGLTVRIQEFRLLSSPELLQLRRSIWEFITQTANEPETRDIAFHLIQDHVTRIHDTPVNESTNEIVAADAKVLLPFLSSTLDPSNYTDAVLMQQYLRFLTQHKVAVDTKLQERFTNETYRLSKILLPDWSLNFAQDRDEAISKEIADYSYGDYLRFFDRCGEIQKHVTRDVEWHQIMAAIGIVLVKLSETNVSLFKKVVKRLLETGNQLGHLYPAVIAKLRLSYARPRYAYKLLKRYEYQFKESWLLAFLSQLRLEQVNQFYLDELYALYRTADVRLFTEFDFLESYRGLDKDVVVNAVRIVFDRSKPGQLANFHYLFTPHSYTFKNLKTLFAGNVELLEEVYLHQSAIDSLVSYGGLVLKSIVELDPDFVTTYLEWLYKEQDYVSEPMEGAGYAALWTLDRYESVITAALEVVFEKEKRDYARSSNYATAFFTQDNEHFDAEIKPAISERMETFISKYIQTHYEDRQRMIFIFDVITECFTGKRLEYLTLFLSLNENYETFERLAIQTIGWTAEGSLVPVFEEKIEFLKSVLPLVSSSKFLNHRIHIENLIRNWEQRIADAKKTDFLR